MIMFFFFARPRKIGFGKFKSYNSEQLKPVLSFSLAMGLTMDVFIRSYFAIGFKTSTGNGFIIAIFPSIFGIESIMEGSNMIIQQKKRTIIIPRLYHIFFQKHHYVFHDHDHVSSCITTYYVYIYISLNLNLCFFWDAPRLKKAL